MQILIAADKFKGSLPVQNVVDAIAMGVLGVLKTITKLNIVKLPLADGGDGTLSILKQYLEVKQICVDTIDPLGRKIKATYLLKNEAAYVELAIASGLALLDIAERNPLHTHNKGTGLLIKDALSKGAKKIVLCLGGSSTNEAGLSIAAALGFNFLDKHGNIIEPKGENLQDIHSYKQASNSINAQFDILCDVTNPLYGKQGAAYTYAAQKGANAEQIKFLDAGLQHIAQLIETQTGVDINSLEGAGAAGGIAGGLVGLLNAQLINGFDFISNLTQIEDKIKQSDLVITGEGNLDASSLQGKVIGKIAQLCLKHHTPLVALVGNANVEAADLNALNIQYLKTIIELAETEKDAMENAAYYLEQMAKSIPFEELIG